jgi:CO dehydrogenase/acetyl-CoA synthase beta subunit
MYYDSTTIIKFRSNDGKFDRLCVVYDKLDSKVIETIQEDVKAEIKNNPNVHYCDIINNVMTGHNYDFELPKVKTIIF